MSKAKAGVDMSKPVLRVFKNKEEAEKALAEQKEREASDKKEE